MEIRDDGLVTYQGNDFMLVSGTRRWRVSRAAVTHLMELVRRADFFKLKGYYRLNVTDLPTYITRISVGTRDKFVFDYGGSGMGRTMASTSFGGPGMEMPSVVTEIENAIDLAADDASWIEGDGSPITILPKSFQRCWKKGRTSTPETPRVILHCLKPAAREWPWF